MSIVQPNKLKIEIYRSNSEVIHNLDPKLCVLSIVLTQQRIFEHDTLDTKYITALSAENEPQRCILSDAIPYPESLNNASALWNFDCSRANVLLPGHKWRIQNSSFSR